MQAWARSCSTRRRWFGVAGQATMLGGRSSRRSKRSTTQRAWTDPTTWRDQSRCPPHGPIGRPEYDATRGISSRSGVTRRGGRGQHHRDYCFHLFKYTFTPHKCEVHCSSARLYGRSSIGHWWTMTSTYAQSAHTARTYSTQITENHQSTWNRACWESRLRWGQTYVLLRFY